MLADLSQGKAKQIVCHVKCVMTCTNLEVMTYTNLEDDAPVVMGALLPTTTSPTQICSINPGVAPIKSQFLLSCTTTSNSCSTAKRNADDRDAEPSEKKRKDSDRKQRRGQNKPNQRPRAHVQELIQLCSFIACGQACSRDGCRFEHDPHVFLASREPDIPGVCPVFDAMGICMKGLRCRFSSSHTDGLNQIIDQSKVDNLQAKTATVNNLSKDLQYRLRKKQVVWHRTEKYMGAMTRTDFASPVEAHPTPLTPPVEVVVAAQSCSPNPVVHAEIAEPIKAQFKILPREKKRLAFGGKTYLAPLTTVGNLPFRRVCKNFGVDITIGEMAQSHAITEGTYTEWALLKRHSSEDFFGVQLAGNKVSKVLEACELINEYCSVDFVDFNLGCPIDSMFGNGYGSALLDRPNRIREILCGMNSVLDCPVTCKIRTGVGKNIAHKLIPQFNQWGIQACTLHGRSRNQRYKHLADWNYIDECAKLKGDMFFFGNGDLMCHEEYHRTLSTCSYVDGIMIARGALIKPWIFTEIKERRVWDISSRERFDMLKDYSKYGLEHWGTDTQGLNITRRFLLEMLSFTHRYIPVGLLETLPQKMNERPPAYVGRNDLETLMASPYVGDWVKISEMLLGPTPPGFEFLPKHKANSYGDPVRTTITVSLPF